MNIKTRLPLLFLMLISVLPLPAEETTGKDYQSLLSGYNALYNGGQYREILESEPQLSDPVLECYLLYMKGKAGEALMLPETALENYERLITKEAALDQETQLLTLLSSLSVFKIYLFSEKRDKAILTLANLLKMRDHTQQILSRGEQTYGIKAPEKKTVELRIDLLCAPYLQLITWQNTPCTIVTIPLDHLQEYKLKKYKDRDSLYDPSSAALHNHWGNTIILYYQGYFRSMANISFATEKEAKAAAEKIINDLDGVKYVIKNLHKECYMIQFGAFRDINRVYEKNRYIEDTLP